jgi:hypothetical protein
MSHDAATSSLRDNASADSVRPGSKSPQNYKAFVAGVFSGVAKLTGERLGNSIWTEANDII